MKLKMLASIIGCFMALASLSAGERGVNGGDFFALEFVSYGLQAIHQYQDLPQEEFRSIDVKAYEQVVFSSKVLIDENIATDAINIPAEKTIYFKASAWQKRSEREKMALAFHEFLGLMGKEISTYGYSVKIVRPELEEQALDSAIPEVVLKHIPRTQHLSYASAQKQCEFYKAMYKDKYFMVFCKYMQNTSYRDIFDVDYGLDYVYLGESEATSSYGVHYRYVSYMRYNHERRPIYGRVLVPYTVTRTIDVSTYGLTVVGLGDLSQLPFKVILDSRTYYSGMAFTFETKAQARIECERRLRYGHADELKFYKAQCLVGQEQNGRHFYQIQSQNPFL